MIFVRENTRSHIILDFYLFRLWLLVLMDGWMEGLCDGGMVKGWRMGSYVTR